MTNKTLRKNLVILRAGDNSLHENWIAGGNRDFDIFISYYGDVENKYREKADFYEMRKGPKWSCIGEFLNKNPQFLDQYDAFWFPDDDLDATTKTINKMLSFFHAFELSLAQPALTQDSFFSWKTLLRRDDYILRYVRFVEIMAPIFSRSALKICAPTFLENRSGWGLDFLWPALISSDESECIAIIDAAPVKHTRPIGGELYKNNPDMHPLAEKNRIIEKYKLKQRKDIGPYEFKGGVGLSGVSLKDKLVLAIRKLNNNRIESRRLRRM